MELAVIGLILSIAEVIVSILFFLVAGTILGSICLLEAFQPSR